jgi:hypothetical protein
MRNLPPVKQPKLDLYNKIVGRLLVTEYVGKGDWLAICTCGNVTQLRSSSLRRGTTKSCGCLSKSVYKGKFVNKSKHGGKYTSEFRAWTHLRQRCDNPNDHRYSLYGARGITYNKSWDSFEQFLKDVGPRPSPNYSLDRIDNNGPYSKENCRWTTHMVQMNNTRRTRKYEYKGNLYTARELTEMSGLPEGRIDYRINTSKWSIERAVEEPLHKN